MFDPMKPETHSSEFSTFKWTDFKNKVKESIAHNFVEAKRNMVNLCIFIGSDHPRDKCIFRSLNGFLIYLNNALVCWYSK